MSRPTLALSYLIPLLVDAAPGQQSPASLQVAVVAADAAHGEALAAILRAAKMRVRRVDAATCRPELLRLVDVVIVDWPDMPAASQPLGELERWNRPTVMLGATGERVASAWGLPTAAELAALPAADVGPEIEAMPMSVGGHGVVWRQGNLFHAGIAKVPAEFDAAERSALTMLVERASQYVSDRPLLRHATANGSPLPDAETGRRERIDAAAKKLHIEPRDLAQLVALPEQFGGANEKAVRQLLVDLVPGSSELDTSKNNWLFWLKSHHDALCWDALSRCWRVDQLAYWRGTASASTRNAARADRGDRDPAALALAEKVASHYGGHALDDLQSFSCWHGDVHYAWDRRRAFFRAENHRQLPQGARGTPWSVSVLDTAANREVIWGGGPPPRPRVSARDPFRELMELVFLPAMLLDPGTQLDRDAANDAGDQQALTVRLGLVGVDPKESLHLLVDAKSGAIATLERFTDGQLRQLWRLESTTTCGPLLLPTAWRETMSRREISYTIEDPSWNPELPAAIDTATDQLTKPRGN